MVKGEKMMVCRAVAFSERLVKLKGAGQAASSSGEQLLESGSISC